MLLKIAVVAGDGIGPEVTHEAVRVLESVSATFGHQLAITRKDIGGAGLLSSNDPLPRDTLQACVAANAVLLGAVGGPAFDKHAGNLRPAICFPGLEDCSPLRPELVQGTDMMIVRELLGGLYFGEPRLIHGPEGSRVATDTMRYGEQEIERIAQVGFELAQTRRKKVLSVDKANVLDCSRLWRDVVNRVAAKFPEVKLSHMYVDSAAMALVARPAEFDVILTENMFGDILSDEAGGIIGSLGLLGSASVGGPVALYEPVHGSAPDIAGKGIANPLGAILSVAMMLRHSFRLEEEAKCVESAVAQILSEGLRTPDLAKGGQRAITTSEMGKKIAETVPKRPHLRSAS